MARSDLQSQYDLDVERDRREDTADQQRDAVLADREAVADERDAELDRRDTPSPSAMVDDWTEMEVRLILSRTDEQLGEAATELAALPETVAGRWVEAAQDGIATAREAIRDLRADMS